MITFTNINTKYMQNISQAKFSKEYFIHLKVNKIEKDMNR